MAGEWVSNNAMQHFLSDLEAAGRTQTTMPSWLRELLSAGLVERDGALLLRQADDANAAHTKRDRFPDLTGYEAFINHFHLDRRDDTLADLQMALGAVDEIRRQLQELPNTQPVRIIISRNLSGEYISSSVRFHLVRSNEHSWLSDDLEGYESEAVAFFDVPPPLPV